MLRRLHILKDLSDLTQPAVTELSNRIILIMKAKTNRNKSKNSNSVISKIKKMNLAGPGPSCTVSQNGETSGLCYGEVEEVNSYTMERVSSLFEYCNSDCPSASELNLLTTLS